VLNVTGYSLGGHLATVFTEMHAAEIQHTYTFNGPGRGTFNVALPDEAAEAQRMQQMISKLTQVLLDPDAGLPTPRPPDDQLPLGYILAKNAQQADPSFDPFAAGNTANLYNDARYLWAKEVAFAQFGPLSSAASDIPRTDGAFSLITQVVGHASQGDTEYVANSGNHAAETSVFIEDQPNFDGFGGLFGASGDFGTTHSITLIVDSLATQELFQTVAPTLIQTEIEAIFAASSNQSASGFVGTSGLAEGNSLENALDVLGKLFVPNYTPTQLGRQTGDFGSLTFRNAFYTNLAAVKTALAGGTFTIEPLVELNAQGTAVIRLTPAEVKTEALENTDRGLAFRYALKNLNPFAVVGADYNGLGHASNGQLAMFDPATGFGDMTEQYLTDRAAFLEAKIELNLRNATTSGDTIYYKDLVGAGYDIPTGSLLTTDQRFLFGSDNDDPPLVGGSEEDHLYGGGGQDLLDGQEGRDYLEGNAGNDVLLGGAGRDSLLGQQGNDLLEGGAENDTLDGGLDNDILRGGDGLDRYIIRAIDGADTIEDSDGKGVVEFDGKVLLGGLQRTGESGNVFHSADGSITYTKQGNDLVVTGSGPLTIKNFTSGLFGVKLFAEAGYAAATRETFLKTVPDPNNPPPATIQVAFFDEGNNHSNDLEDPLTDSTNNLIHALGGNDTVLSGAGDDQLYGDGGDDQVFGFGGNDRLYGGSGNDTLNGDDSDTAVSGNDFLDGGDGDDILQGSAGSDIVFGGIGNDSLNGDDLQALQLGIYGNDYLDGGDGHDELHGVGGSDVLIGGAGNDFLLGDAAISQGGT
ncbi:MAG: calcium-binding protein, partial [Nitrospiraceae bacterium]